MKNRFIFHLLQECLFLRNMEPLKKRFQSSFVLILYGNNIASFYLCGLVFRLLL